VSESYGLQKGDIYKVKKGRGQSNQPRLGVKSIDNSIN